LPPRLEADIYFPVLHGPFGEDGTIQGLFEMAGVPYVGAGVLGSALGMDKVSTKSILHERGLPVVPYLIITEREWQENSRNVLGRIQENIRLPFFVKPSNLGSSVGISKVKTMKATAAALETAFRYDGKILVEKGIQGREIECSVIGNDVPEASLPGEVIPFREFYDYEDKYIEGKTTFVIPVRLSRQTIERIRRLAAAAFKALDVSGLARVDFFLEDGSNRLYINELNTIPGFTEISMFPKLWEATGLSFPQLLERLIELGFERHRARKACVRRGT
jgi:D-alanine-D-alanine ligase